MVYTWNIGKSLKVYFLKDKCNCPSRHTKSSQTCFLHFIFSRVNWGESVGLWPCLCSSSSILTAAHPLGYPHAIPPESKEGVLHGSFLSLYELLFSAKKDHRSHKYNVSFQPVQALQWSISFIFHISRINTNRTSCVLLEPYCEEGLHCQKCFCSKQFSWISLSYHQLIHIPCKTENRAIKKHLTMKNTLYTYLHM